MIHATWYIILATFEFDMVLLTWYLLYDTFDCLSKNCESLLVTFCMHARYLQMILLCIHYIMLNDILYLLPDIWYFLFETFHIPNFLYVTCYLIIIVTCQYAKYDVCDQSLDITCKEIDSSRSYSATRSCLSRTLPLVC